MSIAIRRFNQRRGWVNRAQVVVGGTFLPRVGTLLVSKHVCAMRWETMPDWWIIITSRSAVCICTLLDWSWYLHIMTEIKLPTVHLSDYPSQMLLPEIYMFLHCLPTTTITWLGTSMNGPTPALANSWGMAHPLKLSTASHTLFGMRAGAGWCITKSSSLPYRRLRNIWRSSVSWTQRTLLRAGWT